jgi:hypothetical protein
MSTAALIDDSLAAKEWWLRRLVTYNVGLIVAGILSFICYAAAFEWCTRQPGHRFRVDEEITLFTIAFQAAGYVVMIGIANACYWLGLWAERRIKPVNVVLFRRVLFGLGFWFSVLLPFSSPALTIVSCASH